MDFDFNHDQEMLRDTVRKWIDKGYDFERRRKIVKAGGFERSVWGELADLGLTGLAVPAEHGGMGFGAVDAMVVMEELGRGLLLEPYAQGALVAPGMLAGHGGAEAQAMWLPRIASGEVLVVLAQQERGARYRLDRPATTATGSGLNWRLSGQKTVVPAGDSADAYLVPATVDAAGGADAIGVFLVERRAAGVKVRGYPTQDGARGADLDLTDAPATLVAAPGRGLAALEHGIDIGIAALCAEAVGTMEKLIAITVEYMNTRKQFGVTIATFQALRHRIADVKMQLELARSMSYFASLKMNEPPAARKRAMAQAKLQLGQSTRFVGQQCIQLHGGIAITDEYSASHYFKRLTVMEMTYGDSLHQLGEVAATMQDHAGVFA
ncbi:MAG: acyl-CoA dehydrogenase family protein [Burkholderiaceae bacterium]